MSVAPMNGGSPDATIRTEALHIVPSVPPPSSGPGSRGPVPQKQVIFQREHDPNERLPLTYREYVFTVARGVDEASGERLLRSQLDQVRASIAGARPGKFVNLAVFDVVFQGRPPVPPLATLAWKDWTGEPVVSFPRRPHLAHEPAPHVAPVPSLPRLRRPCCPFATPASAPSVPTAFGGRHAGPGPPPR